jgi:glycosyltransferase involved in cell wall biosynthesis
LDVQALQNPEFRDRGIGRYVLEHTRALLGRRGRVGAVLMNPLRPAPHLPPDLATAPELQWRSVEPLDDARSPVYHLMSPFEMGSPVESLLPPPGLPRGTPIIVTLYDLIPMTDPDRYLPDRQSRLRYAARLSIVRSADAVLAISQYTADDAASRLGLDPERIHVIGGGVARSFRPASDPDAARDAVGRAIPAVTRPFVLSVTGSHDRKNTEGLLDGYALVPAEMRANLQLVITCDAPSSWRERWRSHARAVGLADHEVVITGHVSDSLLLLLYQSALLFVFPSFSEGFGLPVAEAAAAGCPTITSNRTSIPEILRFPDSTFDPAAPDQLAALAAKALTLGSFRDDLRRAGRAAADRTTWEHVAELTVSAIDGLRPQRQRPRARRARLALVGPFPPIPSGVAGYNQRLLAELNARCDLDVFVEPGSDGRALRDEAHRVLPISRLGVTADPASYDAIIYTLGNSVHHHATYTAALRFPGILWLHDVRLHRLTLTWTRAQYGESWQRELDAIIDAQYGPRVPSRTCWSMGDDEDVYEWLTSHAVFFTRHLLDKATSAIVHSEAARRLVELDQPPGAWAPPITVLAHSVPKPPWRTRAPASRPLVVSMGILHPVKAPEKLIQAAASLDFPVDVALVGSVSDEYREQLHGVAAAAGLTGTLHLPGPVEPSDYWGWLQRAWAAVQLRQTWNGESSGAVNDAVAAGLPVATDMPSGADMARAGAVTLLPSSATDADVGEWLRYVLTTPAGNAFTNQDAYAEAHSTAALAASVLEAVVRTASKPAPSSTTRR